MTRKNAISWFEIPTRDLNRAQKFYEEILDIKMTPLDLDNFKMRMFPVEDTMSAGGALCYSDSHIPSETEGPLIYLNANPDVQNALDRAVIQRQGQGFQEAFSIIRSSRDQP